MMLLFQLSSKEQGITLAEHQQQLQLNELQEAFDQVFAQSQQQMDQITQLKVRFSLLLNQCL